jgi:hypothetical protein
MQSWLVRFVPKYPKCSILSKIYYLSLRCDFPLHSVNETRTCTYSSQHLHLDQTPY